MSYLTNIQRIRTAAKYNFLQLFCNRSAVVLQLKVFILKYLKKVSIRKNLQKFHFCHTPKFFKQGQEAGEIASQKNFRGNQYEDTTTQEVSKPKSLPEIGLRLLIFHLRVSKNCTLRKPGVLEYLNIVCTKLIKQAESIE